MQLGQSGQMHQSYVWRELSGRPMLNERASDSQVHSGNNLIVFKVQLDSPSGEHIAISFDGWKGVSLLGHSHHRHVSEWELTWVRKVVGCAQRDVNTVNASVVNERGMVHVNKLLIQHVFRDLKNTWFSSDILNLDMTYQQPWLLEPVVARSFLL